MKKVALSVLALLAVGSFVGAQTVAVSGKASVAYKYDLDASAQSITNSNEFTVAVPFAGAGSKVGTGDVYGSIAFTGATVGIKSENKTESLTGDDYSVTAKIVAGPVSVSFASKPDLSSNYAGELAPLSVDAWVAGTKVKTVAAVDGGVAISYALGDLGSLTLKAGTVNPVTAAAAGASASATTAYVATGTEAVVAGTTYADSTGAVLATALQVGHAYAKTVVTAGTAAVTEVKSGKIGAGLSGNIVAVKDLLTINFNTAYSTATELLGYGGQGIVKFAPVTLTVGYDAQGIDKTTSGSDASVGLAVAFAPFTLGANVYDNLTKDSEQLEYAVTVAGAAVIPGLNFSGYYKNLAQLKDQTTSTYAGGSVDYTIAGYKIYGAGDFDLSSSALAAKAGVSTAALINNVTLSAEWKAGSVNNDKFTNLAITNMKSGAVTIKAEISL